MSSMVTYLRSDLAQQWKYKNIFSVINHLDGGVFRNKEGRCTLKFELNKRSYFLKVYQGLGWKGIIKNIVRLRVPVISARNEWRAINFLERHRFDTVTIAGYGVDVCDLAVTHSFIITDELTNTMSLENLGEQWEQSPPSFHSKIMLLRKLAYIAKDMHDKGMNHRDFYLCHFLLDKNFANNNTIDGDTKLFLIDVHRAQIRKRTPTICIIKDLGSLYFSAANVSLTKRDLFRFMKIYSGDQLRYIIGKHHKLWSGVEKRAYKLRNEHVQLL